MSEHPLVLLLFVMVNVLSAAAFAFIAAVIVPRSELSRRTKRLGLVSASSAALTHLVLATMSLFSPSTTAGEMSTNWPALLLHAVLAFSLWAFLLGVWLERENKISAARRRTSLGLDDEPRP